MTDLAAQVLAALDRAEETAREAAEWAEGPWYVERSESGVFASDRVQVVFDPRGYTGKARTHLDHIAANDPPHVLRLTTALREVATMCADHLAMNTPPSAVNSEVVWLAEDTLRALASVWDVPGDNT